MQTKTFNNYNELKMQLIMFQKLITRTITLMKLTIYRKFKSKWHFSKSTKTQIAHSRFVTYWNSCKTTHIDK